MVASFQQQACQSVSAGKLPTSGSGNTRTIVRIVLLLLCFSLSSTLAQVPGGMPLLQRFTADDYTALPSHYAVVSDARGRIFLGNAEGLLVYDGQRWELVELPLGSVARAMAIGADGRIYVGSYDHFGVIEESADGSLGYIDLRPRFDLDEDDVNLAEIWDVLETPSGLYFRAARRLLFLGYDGRTRHWPLPDEARGFNAVGDTLYARIDGRGLMRWSDGDFVAEPDAERFAHQPLYRMFPRAEGRLLVSREGFLLANGQGIRLLDSPASQLFAEDEPYTGIELPDGSYALGTFGGRVLWFSADLRLLGDYPISAYTILAMGLDREGGLWLATEGEAVRLRMPSPWNRFGPEEGLRGGLYTSTWHEGAMWVATSNGVVRMQLAAGKPLFELAVETSLEANDIESTPSGLLVSDRAGLQLLRPGKARAERLVEDEAIYSLAVSRLDPDRLWAIAGESLQLWQQDETGWRRLHRWPLNGLEILSMHELEPGLLWIGDYRGWPQRWRLDLDSGERRIEILDESSGLQLEAPHGALMLMLDESLHAVSGSRCFSLHGERFEPGCPAPMDRVAAPDELTIVETAAGTFAYTRRELWLRREGEAEWQPLHVLAGLSQGFANVQGGSDGMVRITTWSGLLQFDPDAIEPPPPLLQTSLWRVLALDGEGKVERLPLRAAEATLLGPRTTLQFELQLVNMEGAPQFRYRMEGLQPQWSPWSTDDTLSLRDLRPGQYRIEIESRTRSGRSAQPHAFEFGVTPLWWETRLARLAGILLLLLSMVLVVQLLAWLRLRNYAEQTRRLEQRIAERTAELRDANLRLAEMATVDSLTGVANRRALEHGLAREWQRCIDTGRPIAVIMLDIDHFKQFNDRHGHLEGDERLRWVGGELRQLHDSSRELLARFGGEEFVLVLPGHDAESAMDRAEAIRRRFDGGDGQLTLSIGVAAVDPRQHGNPQRVLKAADEALYRAKRAGRNRVESADF